MELTYLMFPQPEPPPTYQAFQIKMYHHRVQKPFLRDEPRLYPQV